MKDINDVFANLKNINQKGGKAIIIGGGVVVVILIIVLFFVFKKNEDDAIDEIEESTEEKLDNDSSDNDSSDNDSSGNDSSDNDFFILSTDRYAEGGNYDSTGWEGKYTKNGNSYLDRPIWINTNGKTIIKYTTVENGDEMAKLMEKDGWTLFSIKDGNENYARAGIPDDREDSIIPPVNINWQPRTELNFNNKGSYMISFTTPYENSFFIHTDGKCEGSCSRKSNGWDGEYRTNGERKNGLPTYVNDNGALISYEINNGESGNYGAINIIKANGWTMAKDGHHRYAVKSGFGEKPPIGLLWVPRNDSNTNSHGSYFVAGNASILDSFNGDNNPRECHWNSLRKAGQSHIDNNIFKPEEKKGMVCNGSKIYKVNSLDECKDACAKSGGYPGCHGISYNPNTKNCMICAFRYGIKDNLNWNTYRSNCECEDNTTNWINSKLNQENGHTHQIQGEELQSCFVPTNLQSRIKK